MSMMSTSTQGAKGLQGLKQRLNARIIGVIAALVLTFIVFTILEPQFISVDNLLEIGVQSTIIAFVALGLTFVIVTGGIDISVGSIVGLTSVICATNLAHWGTFITIIAAILTTSCCIFTTTGKFGFIYFLVILYPLVQCHLRKLSDKLLRLHLCIFR